MRLRSAFGRSLAVLAIVGLALAPMVRPAMAVPVSKDMHAAMSGSAVDTVIVDDAAADMPCCPVKPALPDCSKDCPLMALCITSPVHFVSQTGLTLLLTFVTVVFPGAHSDLASIVQAPPRKPPKV
jgi:hypothetical protein